MITNIDRREHGIGTNVNKDECIFRQWGRQHTEVLFQRLTYKVGVSQMLITTVEVFAEPREVGPVIFRIT